ncbi:NYN domain-containing protein [Xanthomonas campestris]|uniref:NYN domain-containing protein n=1 Tax=Xanthomonas campestris TaxID=339 RepID=UPI0035561102
MSHPGVLLFIDNSNIFISGKNVAEQFEGSPARQSYRLEFDHLLELALAGRQLIKASIVGSIPPEERAIWERLEAVTGVAPELFERGAGSGKEQGLDQCLQVNMLRAISDHKDPQICVLLTGDGSGYDDGAGFHADLERMYDAGWGIEVLSWRNSCKRALRLWAEKVGNFIALDDHYTSITFLKPARRSTAVDLSNRPVSSVRESPSQAAERKVRNEELKKRLAAENELLTLKNELAAKAKRKVKHDKRFQRRNV